MSKRYRRLIERQAQIVVAERAYDRNGDTLASGALVIIFTSVFYFFGLFIWPVVARVLTGG